MKNFRNVLWTKEKYVFYIMFDKHRVSRRRLFISFSCKSTGDKKCEIYFSFRVHCRWNVDWQLKLVDWIFRWAHHKLYKEKGCYQRKRERLSALTWKKLRRILYANRLYWAIEFFINIWHIRCEKWNKNFDKISSECYKAHWISMFNRFFSFYLNALILKCCVMERKYDRTYMFCRVTYQDVILLRTA
jgi:hypothetical protein